MQNYNVDPHLLNNVLEYCTDFAKTMLSKSGDFYPFGAVIKTDSTFNAIGGYNGEQHPASQELYLMLQNAFIDQFSKSEIIAAALAANVNIPAQFSPDFPDGIRILIECSGYSRFVYIPYKISKANFWDALKGLKYILTYASPIPVVIDSIFIPKA
jgi:hypothetical protein